MDTSIDMKVIVKSQKNYFNFYHKYSKNSLWLKVPVDTKQIAIFKKYFYFFKELNIS